MGTSSISRADFVIRVVNRQTLGTGYVAAAMMVNGAIVTNVSRKEGSVVIHYWQSSSIRVKPRSDWTLLELRSLATTAIRQYTANIYIALHVVSTYVKTVIGLLGRTQEFRTGVILEPGVGVRMDTECRT